MKKELFRSVDKSKISDGVVDAIDQSIDFLIPENQYDYLMPIFSKNDIDIYSDFFKTNFITPNANAGLSSDELKTISYMAKFWKEKSRYNIYNINRYLSFIGYNDNDNGSFIDVICTKISSGYGINSGIISFEEFLGLDDEDYYKLSISIGLSIERSVDGFTDMHDIAVMQ